MRKRRWGLLGMALLPGGGTKFLAIVLVVAMVAGLGGDAITGPSVPDAEQVHGPAQRWGTAAGSDHLEGKPANRTLPGTVRGRYPKVVWDQRVQNTATVQDGPVPGMRGFDATSSRELPQTRGAHERTYANADGTETTEFSTAKVNYRTRDGGWAPIDPRLVEAAGGGWRNAADEVGIRFAASADATDLMTYAVDDDHAVSYSLADAPKVPAKVDGGTAVYAGVRPGVDLRLESQPGGVKETLVLASADAPASYVFPLRLTGLAATVAGGQVVFTDAAGRQRAVVPQGDMVDARGDRSTEVTYRLTTSGSAPALEMTVDEGWLRAPERAFPVLVDPTIQLPVASGAADSGMYVRGNGSSPGGQDLLVGSNSASYLRFGDLVDRLRFHTIFGAQLWVVNYSSASCRPRPVSVHPVTGSWTSSGNYSFPGPAVGGALASKSFAHGYIALGQSSSACPTGGERIDLGAGGRDLVQRWVNGEQANNGLSLRASADNKKFTGTTTANPPKLFVTHSPYNASYRLTDPVPDPPVLQNQDGKVKVTVTNKSAEAWTPGAYYLAYRAYKADTGTAVAQQRSANLTAAVTRGAKVTLDATIKRLPPGKYFLDFTMVRSGGPVFTDHQVPPARLVLQVFDIPPVLQELYPLNGYPAPTLTPQLWARALDIDAPPNSTLRFKFEICERDAAGNPTGCVNSGYQTKTAWTVPAGTLRWTKVYLWRAFVKDATTEVPSPYSTLLAYVPQPEITSHIGAAPKSMREQDFDPQTGNYTTGAVDASVGSVGPALTLTRTYNSLDPRRDALFGAGWSTDYDTKLVPDDDGSGNVVVTYPDGQAVRFGRDTDGTYAAPSGRSASLTANASSWRLVDKSGTTYEFALTGKLTRISDVAGRSIVLSYTDGRLARAQVANSQTNTAGRALYFTWTGNHVTGVRTDPVNDSALAWTYTYSGDTLTRVCAPGSACTTYDYSSGSHYRGTVLDSRPESYWRLGESEGTKAASEIAVNLGKDTASYSDVHVGDAGNLAGDGDTVATFDGRTSTVDMPKGTVKKSRDAAVELWFRNNPAGSGGPLIGYQDKPLGTAATTGVPVLYVGTDGRLRGQFATGSISPITTAATVNDGRWHHVVLSSMGSTQTLYLDGTKAGELTGATIDHTLLTFNQLGAAYASTPGSWPAWGATAQHSYNGSIDEVAIYSAPLGPASVAAHYRAATTRADQLSKVTLPSGRIAATATYDVSHGRVKEYTDDNGGTWKLGTPTVYGGDTDLRRSVEVLDPANRPSLYEFDALGGWLLRFGQPLGVEARPEDSPGEPAPTPPDPVETCTQPDPGDPTFCTTIPDSSGGPVFGRYHVAGVSVRSYFYDEQGRLTQTTDENGDSAWMTYDPRGNPTSQRTCRGTGATDCHTSYTTYPATTGVGADPLANLPTETRDGRSASATDNTYRTTYSYHFTGQVATRTAADGGTTTNTYTTGGEVAVVGGNPPAGLLATATDARGKVTRYAYFANGDLARITTPSGLVTEFGYDAIGRVVSRKEISDSVPAGAVTTYTYDGMSQLRTETAPATTNAVTGVAHQQRITNTYDPDGNVTAVETADVLGNDPARVTTASYNDFGEAITVTDAEGGETGYDYDEFGNTTSRTDPNGNRYDYAYTARNDLAEIRLRNWHSDPEGAPSPGPSDYLVLAAYSYDLSGRLTSETDAMGRRTEHEYYHDSLPLRTVLANFHVSGATTRRVTLAEYTYDGAGNPTKLVTDNGKTVTSNVVDKLGRVESAVLDPSNLNRANAFTYDGNGDVTSVTRSGKSSNVPWLLPAAQEKVSYTYDDAGNRTEEHVTDGTTTRLTRTTFDQRGLPLSTTDPRGTAAGAGPAAFTTRTGYDQLGRPVTATGAPVTAESGGGPATTATPTVTTGYNTFGEPVDVKDELGHVTHTTYDREGRPVRVSAPSYQAPGSTQPITPTTTTRYDGNGNAVEVTDVRGNVTRSDYDQLDRLVRLDTPASTNDERAVTTYAYTRSAQLLSTQDPTGARTETTYDDLDRPVTTTQVERFPTAAAHTTRLTYDDAGNVLTTATPSGATTTNTYDTLGQLTRSVDPNGVQTGYGYDFTGRQVRTADGLGRTTQSTYDSFGQLVAVSDLRADGSTLRTTRYGYDPAGNQTSVTDPLQATRTYAYDPANRLVSQVEPVADGRSITTSFGYDAAGNRTRYTDGRGHATITTFNSLGLAESLIEPATAAQPDLADRTWTVSYDGNGNPVRMTMPGGVRRQRTFDAADRLTAESGAGAEVATADRSLDYDLAGRLVAVNSPTGTNTYAYDDRGDLVSTSGPGGAAEFRYDADGNLVGRTDAAGTATFGYTRGRLSTATATATDGLTGTTQQFGYDAAGAMRTVGYGAGRTRTFGYDDLGRETSDTLTNSANQTVAAAAYTYNLDDTLARRSTTGLAGAAETTYAYDRSGRLTATTSNGATTAYEWDDAGNRTKAGPKTATYDERNRLQSDGDHTYTYSARGALRSRTTAATTEQFSFDAFDRMVSDAGQTYGYDGLDRVTTGGGTTFTYAGQGDEPVAAGAETYARGPSGELLATSRGDTERVPVADVHGDVVADFDPADSTLTKVADSTGYDPFGTVTARTGNTGALGFQGDWTDQATGRVDMGARWYDPATGGFTSRDDADYAGGDAVFANRYTYAAANPVTYTDPDGHWPCISFSCAWEGGRKFWSQLRYWPWLLYRSGIVNGGAMGAVARPATGMSGYARPVWRAGYTARPIGHGGGGGGGGRGGHGGDSWFDRAKRIADEARKAAEKAAKGVAVVAPPILLEPILHGPVVSAAASAPAKVVDAFKNVVDDAEKAANDIYKDATDKVGNLIKDVSNATRIIHAADEALDHFFKKKSSLNRRYKDDCRSRLPRTNYMPVDAAHGGRATGIEACLWDGNIAGGTYTRDGVNPPGRPWALRKAARVGGIPEVWINRCHLLGKQLGGSGTRLDNLSTCSRTANDTANVPADAGVQDQNQTPNMKQIETQVRNAIRDEHQIVLYKVTPHYLGDRTVPYEYAMDVEGTYPDGRPGLTRHVTVDNSIYGPNDGRRHNLGTDHDRRTGKPIPVATTR